MNEFFDNIHTPLGTTFILLIIITTPVNNFSKHNWSQYKNCNQMSKREKIQNSTHTYMDYEITQKHTLQEWPPLSPKGEGFPR
jgi:hypothetical protein